MGRGEERRGGGGDFYRLPDEYGEEGTKTDKDKALRTLRYFKEKEEKSEQQLREEEQTDRAAGDGTKKKSCTNLVVCNNVHVPFQKIGPCIALPTIVATVVFYSDTLMARSSINTVDRWASIFQPALDSIQAHDGTVLFAVKKQCIGAFLRV